MSKRTLASLFLCLTFGAFSCTDSSSGYFADDGSAPGDQSGGTGSSGAAGGSGTPEGGDHEGAAAAPPIPTGDGNPPPGDPSSPPEPVPEPMTMLLFGSGLAGVAYRYRRKKGPAPHDAGEALEA